MQSILQRAIASATNSTGHLLRLSASELLIAAPFSVLLAAGLAPTSHKSLRLPEVQVTEITNSLQLREAMGLVNSTEAQIQPGKPLVH